MSILTNILNTVAGKKSFYIPAGMVVTGTFTVDVPGQIAGTVNGDVIVNGRLVILKHGVINGNVQAHEIEMAGSVTGNIQCTGKMVLKDTSFIKGNVSSVEIHLEKDAVVEGAITKPGSHDPNLGMTASMMEEETLDESEEPIQTPEPVPIKVENEEVQSWF